MVLNTWPMSDEDIKIIMQENILQAVENGWLKFYTENMTPTITIEKAQKNVES